MGTLDCVLLVPLYISAIVNILVFFVVDLWRQMGKALIE